MRKATLQPLLHLLLLVIILSSTYAAEDLISAKFDAVINSGKNGLVKFYQSWCGHCTRMKPDWDKLSLTYIDSSTVFIASVNCGANNNESLCKLSGIQGYPTLKYYKQGNEHNYEGGRGYDDLVEFVKVELDKQCDIYEDTENTCSEKAKAYAQKWLNKKEGGGGLIVVEKEVARLKNMLKKGDTMTRDLKWWLKERIHLLKQIIEKNSEQEL